MGEITKSLLCSTKELSITSKSVVKSRRILSKESQGHMIVRLEAGEQLGCGR